MNHSQNGAERQESLSEVNLGVGNVGWRRGSQRGLPGDSLQGKGSSGLREQGDTGWTATQGDQSLSKQGPAGGAAPSWRYTVVTFLFAVREHPTKATYARK